LSDKNVKAIFINIFGGIVRCDRIANGIIEATKSVTIDVPVIVRLDGTNAEEAKKILKSSGIKQLISVGDLNEGAEKAVELVKK
jgi:succinyl-CoA synthetase beta subunit